MDIPAFISQFYIEFPHLDRNLTPWAVLTHLEAELAKTITQLSEKDYVIKKGVAIHKSAQIETGVTLKKNTIIGKDCVVKSGAYLRNGVYLCNDVGIGANCEIKQSIIFPKSRIAHLNYVGNSLIGEDVNLEAGSVLANHFNEFKNRTVRVVLNQTIVDTQVGKFGSLIGDHCRIGANAVLNPGSILKKNTVIGRLQHLDQLQEFSRESG